MRSVLFTLPWRGLQDVINSEDHFRGLCGLDDHLALHGVALGDAQLHHVANLTLKIGIVLKMNPCILKILDSYEIMDISKPYK